MPVLRTIVDINIPDSMTKGDVSEYERGLRDYASVILGPELTEKTTEELDPWSHHHIHNSAPSRSCRTCLSLAEDGRK